MHINESTDVQIHDIVYLYIKAKSISANSQKALIYMKSEY